MTNNLEKFHISNKIFIVKDNKFLLIKTKEDNSVYYDCPGGRANINEPNDSVLFREVYEEIGLDLSPHKDSLELFDINHIENESYDHDSNVSLMEIYFKLLLTDVDVVINCISECFDYEWIDSNANIDSFPVHFESRKDIYKKIQSTLEKI